MSSVAATDTTLGKLVLKFDGYTELLSLSLPSFPAAATTRMLCALAHWMASYWRYDGGPPFLAQLILITRTLAPWAPFVSSYHFFIDTAKLMALVKL